MAIKNSLETIRKWDSNSSEIRVGFFDKVYFLQKTKPNASFLKKSINKTSRFISKFFHEGLWVGRKSNKQKLLALYKKIALNKDATFEQTEVIVVALDKHINIFNKKIASLHAKTKTTPNKREQLEKKEQNKKALLEQFILLKKELVKKDIAKLQKDFPLFAPAFESSNNLEEIIENVEKINLPDQETSKKQILQKLHTLQQHEVDDEVKTGQESLSQLKEQFPQFQEAFNQSKIVEEVIEKVEKIQTPGHEDAKVQLLERLRMILPNHQKKETDPLFFSLKEQFPQFQDAFDHATDVRQVIKKVAEVKTPDQKKSKKELLLKLNAYLQRENEEIKLSQLKEQYPQFNDAFEGTQSLTRIIESLEQINIAGQETSRQKLLEKLNLLKRNKRFSTEGRAKGFLEPYFDDGRLEANVGVISQTLCSEWSSNFDKVESIHLFGIKTNQDGLEKIAECIKSSPNLKDVNIFHLNYDNELKILEDAILEKKNLKCLCVCDDKFKLTDSSIKKLHALNPKLEKLAFNFHELTEEGYETLRKFSDLKDLNIFLGFESPSSLLIEEVKKGFPTVESLSLITLSAANPPRVIQEARQKAYESLISNIKNYPNLRCLNINDPWEVMHILKKLPKGHQINEFKINLGYGYLGSNSEANRFAEIKEIQKLIGEMQSLDLKKLTILGYMRKNFGYEAYEALEKLKTLEYLEIPYPANGGELKILKRLIQNLPNLKTLYIQPLNVEKTLKAKHISIGIRRIPTNELVDIRNTFESRPGFVIEEAFIDF